MPRELVLRSEGYDRGVPAKDSGERCGATQHKPGESARPEHFDRHAPS